tara:strand:+ start:2522 stop:2653 length:132 start_codon:yes stop_codon:yes gene_type:complete
MLSTLAICGIILSLLIPGTEFISSPRVAYMGGENPGVTGFKSA